VTGPCPVAAGRAARRDRGREHDEACWPVMPPGRP